MNMGERIRLASQRQREYTENAHKYQLIKKRIQTSFILLCVLNVITIFSSMYTFFFETQPKSGNSVNAGLVQLALGLFSAVFSILCVHNKSKKILYITAIPILPLIAYAVFGNTILRASIHNWIGIPIESYINIRWIIIVFCVLLSALLIILHKNLTEYEAISKCEGFPHFSLRCEKLEDYMPDEYSMPENRRDTPDTLTSDDMQKYTDITSSQTSSTYTPGVMDTIEPVFLDEDE